MSTNNEKLAVLIDADNAQASVIHDLLAEVSRYGVASVKRAYGDWTIPHLKSWKEVLHKLAIQPVQQFSYTTGKNSTDSSLIIDAMDLLHSGKLDGFCLVSSDSDFTRLATRIREAGLTVYGFGEKKTPAAFVAACDKFSFTEILKPPTVQPPGGANLVSVGEPAAVAPDDPLPETLESMIRRAVTATTKDNGWAPLSAVGSLILKISPSFDPRNYGCQKLGELVRKQSYLEIKEVPGREESTIVHLHARLKAD